MPFLFPSSQEPLEERKEGREKEGGERKGKEGERKEITWMKIIQSNSKEIKLKLYIITL